MSEIKIFNVGEVVEEIKPATSSFSKNIQQIIENNSKKIFGVSLVASNYQIGSGRVATVGLDENRCPVIFVYSLDEDKNFLSKGLYALEQVLDHKDRFNVSVSSKLGKKAAEAIDWSMPRIIFIASGYNKYDRTAVNHMNSTVSLVQYNQYGQNILIFELVESNVGASLDDYSKTRNSFAAAFKKSNSDIKALFDRMCEYVYYLGETVTINHLKNYVAFKKIKNFAAVRVEGDKIVLNLNLEPSKYVCRGEGYKDVSFATKYGTGLLQYTFSDEEGYQEAKRLLLDAYNKN